MKVPRARAIELLQRVIDAHASGRPLEGFELLEATYALAYAKVTLQEAVSDEAFVRVVTELTPWLT